MTTYNTGNPIGSKDPRDLYDNAENLDEAVNTRQAESWDDRFGVARKTWWGMEQDFQQFLINSGYENIGDYGPGLEITARNQIFWRDGELYRAGAALELPYTTTGDWGEEEGLFVAVGDQSLRQELASQQGSGLVGFPEGRRVIDLADPGDDGHGDAMLAVKQAFNGTVARTQHQKNAELVSVKDFGLVNDGVTDNYAAFLVMRDQLTASGKRVKVWFPGDEDGRSYLTSGTFDFSWPEAHVIGDGRNQSEIEYTGSGTAVLFSDENPNHNEFAFGGTLENIGIKGNANATALLRIKSVNHMYVRNINLREASSTEGYAMVIQGVVCGHFDHVVCSTNAQPMVSRPYCGILVERDPDSLNRATDNLFINPIIEGMQAGGGIQLTSSDQTMMLGGTSENNSGNGLMIAAGSRMNTFISVAFENHATEVFADVSDSGFSNKFINCYTGKLFYVGGSALFSKLEGGFHQSILDEGDYSTFENLYYSFFQPDGTVNRSPSSSARGLINFQTGQQNDLPKNNIIVPVGPSPFVYINNSNIDEDVILTGTESISQVVFGYQGSLDANISSLGMITLRPGYSITVSHSGSPSIVRYPKGNSYR